MYMDNNMPSTFLGFFFYSSSMNFIFFIVYPKVLNLKKREYTMCLKKKIPGVFVGVVSSMISVHPVT